MQLVDGAAAIRGDLPSVATRDVPVPDGAGDALGTGISRFSSLVTVRERLREALDTTAEPAVCIGGGCGIEIAAIDRAMARHAGDLAVVWLDAHPDLHTPDTAPSGSFDRMALRSVLGDGHEVLSASAPVAREQVVIAGMRSMDDAEARYLDDSRMRSLPARDFSVDLLTEAVDAVDAAAVYIHLDLDVLDPAEIDGTHWAEPFGPTTAAVADAIRTIGRHRTIAGAGITGFAPATPAAAEPDLPVVLRLLGALTAEREAKG